MIFCQAIAADKIYHEEKKTIDNKTLSALLDRAVIYLAERGVETARLDAEVLLAHVLGEDRYKLYLSPSKELKNGELAAFGSIVKRRGMREPLQYIIGHQEFWSREFEVDERVLIPRPETEKLVETTLEIAGRTGKELRIVDLGCGCGNIAVSLAGELPSARLLAVDVSREALILARRNVLRHGVQDRVGLICADMFSFLDPRAEVDLIVSNPPYIDSLDFPTLQPEVAMFEPGGALDGGRRGLEVIGRLLESSLDFLAPGGYLIFEAGAGQAGPLKEMIDSAGRWLEYRVIQDYSGLPRVHVLEKK